MIDREQAIEAATRAYVSHPLTIERRVEAIADAILALPDPVHEAAREQKRELTQSSIHEGAHLDLAALRSANVARMHRWHGEDDEWTLADWSNAMCGEAGEAANVVKKIRRTQTPGLWDAQKYPGDGAASGVGTLSSAEANEALLSKLADECADVLCYLDLLAHKAGIDLARAVVAKFNRVSEAQGFPDRLDAALNGGERWRPVK